MTIIGNAARWALLFPLALFAVAVAIVTAFSYGVAAFLTNDATIRALAGFLSLLMACGAFAGAYEAHTRIR